MRKTEEAIKVNLLGSRGEVARSHLDGDKTPFKDVRVLTCQVGQSREESLAYVFFVPLLSKCLAILSR